MFPMFILLSKDILIKTFFLYFLNVKKNMICLGIFLCYQTTIIVQKNTEKKGIKYLWNKSFKIFVPNSF